MMNLFDPATFNNQSYGAVLDAYSQGASALSASLPAIYQGYSGLAGNVANVLGQGGTPWGVAQPAATAIQQTFEKTGGNIDKQMINAGLTNTSVRGALQNQNALQAGQAYAGLGAQLAQTYAGYLSNLGLAGLGAKMQGSMAQANLQQNKAQTMAGLVRTPMPAQFGGIMPSRGGGGGGGGYPAPRSSFPASATQAGMNDWMAGHISSTMGVGRAPPPAPAPTNPTPNPYSPYDTEGTSKEYQDYLNNVYGDNYDTTGSSPEYNAYLDEAYGTVDQTGE